MSYISHKLLTDCPHYLSRVCSVLHKHSLATYIKNKRREPIIFYKVNVVVFHRAGRYFGHLLVSLISLKIWKLYPRKINLLVAQGDATNHHCILWCHFLCTSTHECFLNWELGFRWKRFFLKLCSLYPRHPWLLGYGAWARGSIHCHAPLTAWNKFQQ